MIYVRKKQLTPLEERVEKTAEITKSLTLRIVKVIAPYFLVMFFARWFFIILGEDVKPSEIIEQKALEFFRKLRGQQ